MKNFALCKKALVAVILIFLPISIIFVYSYRQSKERLIDEALGSFRAIAEGYEGQTLLFLEMNKSRANDFSSDGFTHEGVGHGD
jgi:hypothetical protein